MQPDRAQAHTNDTKLTISRLGSPPTSDKHGFGATIVSQTWKTVNEQSRNHDRWQFETPKTRPSKQFQISGIDKLVAIKDHPPEPHSEQNDLSYWRLMVDWLKILHTSLLHINGIVMHRCVFQVFGKAMRPSLVATWNILAVLKPPTPTRIHRKRSAY